MRIGIRKIQSRILAQYALVYFLFLANGACLYEVYIYTPFNAYLITVATVLLYAIFKIGFNKKLFVLSVVSFVGFAIVALLNGTRMNVSYVLFILSNFWISNLAYKLDKQMFLTRFIKIVTVFSVISIGGFIMRNYAPDTLVSLMPSEYHIIPKSSYRGLLFYVYQPDNLRNVGIFYEPGVYQVSLIMALYAILFMPDRIFIRAKRKTVILLVLMITLVTTQSTTGYIGLSILLLGYILLKNKEKSMRRKIIFIAIAVLGVVLVDYFTNGTESLLQKILFDKIMGISQYDSEVSSGGARWASILIALQCIISNPFGVDVYNWDVLELKMYSDTSIATGAILVKFLACYGVIAFLAIMTLLFEPAYKNRQSNTAFWVFVLLFINITLAQSKIAFPSIIIISLMEKKLYNFGDNISTIHG